ncbi:hypothetical protein H8356DRAFT_1081335 [Neocallimastix lanati (nom. inval.)]|nr:hypothetical protein H8356DRAFT_1081335 [Neocallimastix sp. JGI-2020a]
MVAKKQDNPVYHSVNEILSQEELPENLKNLNKDKSFIMKRESPEYVKEYYKEVLLNTKFQLINVPFTPNNINNTDNKNRNNIASSSSSSSSNNNNNEVNGPYRAYNHNSVSLYESYTGEDEDEVLNEENRFSTYDSDTASSENEDYMEITGNEVMHTERGYKNLNNINYIPYIIHNLYDVENNTVEVNHHSSPLTTNIHFNTFNFSSTSLSPECLFMKCNLAKCHILLIHYMFS